ncbi:protein RhsA [Salmonella enterica subsp. salamae]|nr:protein RhsA [Salmonella enterica subsp. salamae]
MRISGPQQTREYRYSEAGRLTGVHTTAANLDITLPYATDPAGNRLPDPAFYLQSSSTVWADNRITEDMQYRYRYDRYGRLTEKTDRIPEGVIRMHDERTHRYDYDSQHRLVRYVRTQYGETQAEGRYVYDPTGRRVGKRVWKREPVHWSETRTELSARPYETWYGWEGDRLTAIRTQQHRSLAEKLAQCGLMAEQMKNQLEPRPEPERKVHLYHCDHRGLPLALISPDNTVAWRAEYDEWGNLLGEENPEHLEQLIRLPGQQYDEESGLHYNRHRYYSPGLGRYITQDPIGLIGGWNGYAYPLNPVQHVDPLGLSTMIIGNGPVPDNPFGHAAAANRYGLMSSGTGDEMGASVSDYFKKMQPRRDTWIWIIDTTDEEEQCMMNKAIDLNKNLKTISLGPLPIANNCFSRTNMIFEACGFSNPSMNTNTPISLQVLGELYGSQKYIMPKGPFTGFPFEFQEVK